MVLLAGLRSGRVFGVETVLLLVTAQIDEREEREAVERRVVGKVSNQRVHIHTAIGVWYCIVCAAVGVPDCVHTCQVRSLGLSHLQELGEHTSSTLMGQGQSRHGTRSSRWEVHVHNTAGLPVLAGTLTAAAANRCAGGSGAVLQACSVRQTIATARVTCERVQDRLSQAKHPWIGLLHEFMNMRS